MIRIAVPAVTLSNLAVLRVTATHYDLLADIKTLPDTVLYEQTKSNHTRFDFLAMSIGLDAGYNA